MPGVTFPAIAPGILLPAGRSRFANIIRNSDFASATGWTLTGQMAITGGKLSTGTGGASSDLAATTVPAFVTGGLYVVSYSGNFNGAGLFLGQTAAADHAFVNGTVRVVVAAGGNAASWKIRRGSAVDGALLDYIRIRRVA